MASQREQIAAAAFSKLQTLTTVPVSRVYRSRETAIARDETPAIVLRKSVEPAPQPKNVHERKLELAVEIYVRSDTPEISADPIEVEVHEKLMSDRQLNNTCILLEPGDTDWEAESADLIAARTTMKFIALYRRDANLL